MKKIPELLSPAGNIDCLKAAINGGADAVYFGVPRFNARMKARNFTPDELDEAFSLCALHGVKTNITLNTLLFGRELKNALEVVRELERNYMPDAYIVQDIGLAALLKVNFPDIVLHASTQAEVHNAFGLEPFKKLGFSRVVIAREASKSEIEAFCDCGIETEIFIHGAMCVCQSGGCLMSSMIGGRSGNRGECAYPCRLPYKGKNPYPLSLKDMCLAAHIPEILSLGVDALKIEGRMKTPEYVYEVTSLYRALLDEKRAATADELRREQAVFSRSGFTDGYFTKKISPSMFGVRSEHDKKCSREVVTTITERKIPVEISADVTSENGATAVFRARGVSAQVTSADVNEAKTQPLTPSEVEGRLARLGGTPFEPSSVTASVDGGIFMTASALNSLRRSGITALTAAICSGRHREKAPEASLPVAEPKTAKVGLTVRMGLAPNAEHIDAATRYEIPLERPDVWKKLAPSCRDKLCLVMPRTVYDGSAGEIKALLAQVREVGITKITVENLEFLPLCSDFEVYGGLCLNVTNKNSYDVLARLGAVQTVISPEANMALAAEVGGGYAVYGKMPLMHTRTCIITNICGCQHERDCHNCGARLCDRTGAIFEVRGGYGHTNTVYNSIPLWLLDRDITVKAPLLYFTTESPSDERKILRAYFDKKPSPLPFTRGANK